MAHGLRTRTAREQWHTRLGAWRGLVILLLLAAAGCDPPPLTGNGVIGAFGTTGMGPGDFSYPRGITINPMGQLFVVDKTSRIQRFSLAGEFERQWTMPELEAGKPVGLFAHPDGRVFVADTHYHRVIVYDVDGHELSRFGREGTGDGEFMLPTDVAVDAQGCVYVSEYGGNDRISKFTPDYQFVKAFAREAIDGLTPARPQALAIDRRRTLWVADSCNHRILRYNLDGQLLSWFGKLGREPGELRYPYDLACLPDGTLMVCEYGNCRLQWFDENGRSLGTWGGEGRELGQLWSPWAAAIGPNDVVYAVDSRSNRVQMIRLSSVARG